ncbi:glycoside hydrolase 43 family protein [Kitasatospora sp. NE20-6]|uniref:family 43 glycosylhydrolase n=1 Tax=Kitasatospora sp. NE20-6 TaxID=2859066 RepID=UPI0034DC12C6
MATASSSAHPEAARPEADPREAAGPEAAGPEAARRATPRPVPSRPPVASTAPGRPSPIDTAPAETSLARADGGYYLATATRDWLPGILLHRSEDLVDWQPLGGALAEPRLIDLAGVPDAGGVRGPSLSRSADGTFHLVYSDLRGRTGSGVDAGAFVVTAPSPQGRWSDPAPLAGPGADPFLFHDDGPGGDGRTMVLRVGPEESALLLQEYDRERRTVTGPLHRIRIRIPADHGAGPLAHPRLHRHGGWYYLLGLVRRPDGGAAVAAARSAALTGPYQADPAGPLLQVPPDTPEGAAPWDSPADLVRAPDGNWLLACGSVSFGEEAARAAGARCGGLYRIDRSADGWPRAAVPAVVPAAPVSLPAAAPVAGRRGGYPVEGFGARRLGPEWLTLRRHADPSWLTVGGGRLVLRGEAPLSSRSRRSVVARPVRDGVFDFRVMVSADPRSPLRSAGLLLYRSAESWHQLHLGWDEELGRVLRVGAREGDGYAEPARPVAVGPGPVRLRLSVDGVRARFRWYDRRVGPGGRTGWRAIGPAFDPAPGRVPVGMPGRRPADPSGRPSGGQSGGSSGRPAGRQVGVPAARAALQADPACGAVFVGVFAEDRTGLRGRAVFSEPYYRGGRLPGGLRE